MDENIRTNLEFWNSVVASHEKSDFYDVRGFKGGKCTLDPIEIDEVGDVKGKSLLHLQCHFGLDTMSWARRGARPVGVDFSEEAIKLARSIASELKLDAEFYCTELEKLSSQLNEEFDIVFTSGGVLAWLPDLRVWAGTITHFLKPGGFFYIREFHPTAYVYFDEGEKGLIPTVHYPYFEQSEPLRLESVGSYAADGDKTVHPTREWPHPLSEIINSLIGAGLTIEFLHEFPYSSYRSHPFLAQTRDGRWRYPEKPDSLPLMFSLKAKKGILAE
jgi:SAM-dependent methyltransferase